MFLSGARLRMTSSPTSSAVSSRKFLTDVKARSVKIESGEITHRQLLSAPNYSTTQLDIYISTTLLYTLYIYSTLFEMPINSIFPYAQYRSLRLELAGATGRTGNRQCLMFINILSLKFISNNYDNDNAMLHFKISPCL